LHFRKEIIQIFLRRCRTWSLFSRQSIYFKWINISIFFFIQNLKCFWYNIFWPNNKQYKISQNCNTLQHWSRDVAQTPKLRGWVVYKINVTYYNRKEIMIDDEIMVGRRRPLYSQMTSYNIHRRSQCIYNNIKTYMVLCMYRAEYVYTYYILCT